MSPAWKAPASKKVSQPRNVFKMKGPSAMPKIGASSYGGVSSSVKKTEKSRQPAWTSTQKSSPPQRSTVSPGLKAKAQPLASKGKAALSAARKGKK